jgi:hypothetical protein
MGDDSMAIDANSARQAAWNTTYNEYLNLSHQLDQARPEDREALERAVADQQDDVLDTPAPSFSALLTKLELLFEGQLEGLDAEAEYRRLVIEDLSDLIAETRELVGAQSPALA